MLVGCLSSQQHASVSQGWICSDNLTCCHTEIEVADPTFHLTQSQYTDTGPTSPCADPTTPGAWQGSHWSASFQVTGMTRPRKNPCASRIRTQDEAIECNRYFPTAIRHELYLNFPVSVVTILNFQHQFLYRLNKKLAKFSLENDLLNVFIPADSE